MESYLKYFIKLRQIFIVQNLRTHNQDNDGLPRKSKTDEENVEYIYFAWFHKSESYINSFPLANQVSKQKLCSLDYKADISIIQASKHTSNLSNKTDWYESDLKI